MLKKMEQAKKKAEAVVNTVDISEREKMAQLRGYVVTSVERSSISKENDYSMNCWLPIGGFLPDDIVNNVVLSCLILTVSTRKQAWGKKREK